MKDYKVYKDLSLREAKILRVYELAICACSDYAKKVQHGEGTSRDLIHAAWIYRKYIYCLEKTYYFVSRCAFLKTDGTLVSATGPVKHIYKEIIELAEDNRETVKSVLKGGWAYQLMDNTIGKISWNEEFKASVKEEMYDFTHECDLLDAGYSPISSRMNQQLDDRGKIVVVEFLAFDHAPILTFAVDDSNGNLQYQHPLDLFSYRPIIMDELRGIHYRWHEATEEQAAKYWQLRMTAEEND